MAGSCGITMTRPFLMNASFTGLLPNHYRPALLLAGLLAAAPAISAESDAVCARFQKTQHGWTQPTEFGAIIAKGTELNQATKSRRYADLSTYVVLYPDDDPEHILKLELPQLMRVAQPARDTFGRRWEISLARPCV